MAGGDQTKKFAQARRMRKSPAVTEDLLWELLRDRRLDGIKFRRQVPVGRYIADFVCFRHRLIVEADGPFHEDSFSDAQRDEWLVGRGFHVLRFKNADVWERREQVIDAVLKATGRN